MSVVLLPPPQVSGGTLVPWTHMHDICTVVENLHIGLQDVKVEGWSQHTTVTAPLVTGTQQEPITWEGSHD
jgi:hypothetical protein